MAVVITLKDSGTSLSNGFDTASLSMAANTRAIIAVVTALDSPVSFSGHSASGGGVSWAEIQTQGYSGRRIVSLFRSDGVPSGIVTITANFSGGTYQESKYGVFEVAGLDLIDPDDAPVSAENDGSSSFLNSPDVGTIDAGDMAFMCCGFEGGADSLAVASGTTELLLSAGGSNVRSLICGHSTTDDTPGVTWSGTGNGAGIIGINFNVGGGAPANPTLKMMMSYH